MKKLLAILTITALLCVTGLFLFAPIIPSSWDVAYQQDGKEKKEGITRSLLFVSDYIIVELPKSLSDPNQEGRNRIWSSVFLISLDRQRVLIPVAYGREFLGFKYLHKDQLKGVDITGGKVNDGWTVLFEEDQITFTNPKITVILNKRA
ncbi:MAG: hypothetical protein CML13_03260 [Puniceicoccaceae bacterium]|nr:hypothetical protein [Puniceicoccaceae bacterium]|tara:strand:- start:91 stop:537 length:447 start_codon:yes stop_codon:yes gene_type:complete